MADLLCAVTLTKLKHGIQAVTLSNPFLEITVLPEKGADIYSLVHRAAGVDVLWKSPQGLRLPNQGRFSPDSSTAWLEMYEGGWQEILPNGGDACQYKGTELSFHGESTTLPWQYEIITQSDQAAAVEFSVRLYRSPLAIRRRMALDAHTNRVQISEAVTNWSAEPYDFMWGHHPAYGAPFLSGQTRLYTNARTLLPDDSYDQPTNVLVPGARGSWPMVARRGGGQIDLSVMPAEDERRDMLAYLLDFDGDPWYALANPELGVGVGMAWSAEIYRCLWLWQEIHSTRGFPWYGSAYTVAVEPWSSYPGFGLVKVLDTTKTHHHLEPGATLTSKLSVSLFDITRGRSVTRVDPDGHVQLSN